jgi:LPS sulfotransferase NodH
MLTVGIDTGYEGKFDFPWRADPPAITYLLASVPRTGSTWFSHILWRSGCLGAPLEYLNFEPAGPYFFASRSPHQQLNLWHSVLHRRTSPNGVFGIKCFPPQLHDLQQNNPPLLSEVMETLIPKKPPRRAILFARRDQTAHAISYARALTTGIWRSEQESGARPEAEYSDVAVDRARKLLDGQAEAWDSMFRDLHIEPLKLWYEDALEDPAAAVSSVADCLGVEIDPDAAVEVPEIRRQSQVEAQEWAKQHARRERG